MEYFSQDGQDRFIDQEIFGGQDGGFFLDIGAHDGITFSNTYFFEKYRKWKGVCVEANPKPFAKLIENRRCVALNACISNEEIEDVFLYIEGYSEMLSGLKSKYDRRHLDRIENEIIDRGGSVEELPIKTWTVSNVARRFEFDHVDYCSIDTEGSELAIIQSIDFSAISISVISIENNFGSNQILNFLSTRNYDLIAKIGADEVYILGQQGR